MLPYNLKLKTRATEMRHSGNHAEVILWSYLCKRRMNNLRFYRQRIIGNYIVDFFCAERSVIIEVDGGSHNEKQEYDAERDAYLMGLGLTMLHVKADDVQNFLPQIIKTIREHPALKALDPNTPL